MEKKIVGIEKIDELINGFVEKFGCTASLGEEFCYWHDDETIDYSLVISVPSDEAWKEYVKEKFNFCITNIFMFSLLHEVGHHFTMDNFSKLQQNKEQVAVAKIESDLKDSDSEELDKEMYIKYFDLPMEKSATKWAVKYYRTHRQAINRFYRKLNKELQIFYKKNGLFETE